jgi:hypothetical protein
MCWDVDLTIAPVGQHGSRCFGGGVGHGLALLGVATANLGVGLVAADHGVQQGANRLGKVSRRCSRRASQRQGRQETFRGSSAFEGRADTVNAASRDGLTVTLERQKRRDGQRGGDHHELRLDGIARCRRISLARSSR